MGTEEQPKAQRNKTVVRIENFLSSYWKKLILWGIPLAICGYKEIMWMVYAVEKPPLTPEIFAGHRIWLPFVSGTLTAISWGLIMSGLFSLLILTWILQSRSQNGKDKNLYYLEALLWGPIMVGFFTRWAEKLN